MTIKNYLKSHSFTLLEIEKIISFGEVVSLKKGECFLKENEFCNQIGMLLTGLLCGYYFDSNGNKKIFRFYYNPDFYLVVDYENFVKNTHSNLNIEALEETTLFVFKKEALETIYNEMPKFRDLQQQEITNMFIRTLRIIKIFQTTNTTERIRLLQNNAPELFTKVPYSHLASFLGVHRNTFNKAMKKL